MIKLVAFAATIYTVLAVAGAAYYVNLPFSISVLLGGLTVLLNIAGLSFTWRLIFMKKSIALAVLVIIFKYLLLGIVLLSLMKFKWLSPVGFCIGLGSLLFGVVAAAIFNSLARKD
jgi:hypothetical protein